MKVFWSQEKLSNCSYVSKRKQNCEKRENFAKENVFLKNKTLKEERKQKRLELSWKKSKINLFATAHFPFVDDNNLDIKTNLE